MMKIAFACALAAAVVFTSVSAYPQEGSASVPTNQSTKAGRAADRALSKKVRTALVKAKIVDSSGITVRAKNGSITLEGSVREQSEIEHAGEVAQSVSGVTSVRNALTIRQPGQ
ncbi:hyperosmotically inducible periplasmic protein [Paraburkholderia sacchari]|uniref:BON domain-containing protein n=1 Tax=Paraburkholderia sacchari TaxID=159450 RepID=UPI0039A54C32